MYGVIVDFCSVFGGFIQVYYFEDIEFLVKESEIVMGKFGW